VIYDGCGDGVAMVEAVVLVEEVQEVRVEREDVV
jgi:hypothetical protein